MLHGGAHLLSAVIDESLEVAASEVVVVDEMRGDALTHLVLSERRRLRSVT
jgi:hypothetical protein